MKTFIYEHQRANICSSGLRKQHIVCDCNNQHFKQEWDIISLGIPGGGEGISGSWRLSVSREKEEEKLEKDRLMQVLQQISLKTVMAQFNM